MRLTVFIVLLFSGVVQGQDLKNVQVLPYKNTREIVPYMKGMAKDLGVKCSYCHNMKNKSLAVRKKSPAFMPTSRVATEERMGEKIIPSAFSPFFILMFPPRTKVVWSSRANPK